MPQIRDEKLLKKISLVLKQLRAERDLTQEDVFNDTDIHIARIESAKANITVSTLAALCKYYKIRLSAFYELVEAV
jgi:transcriptional regulator with XRE-family HTH domain